MQHKDLVFDFITERVEKLLKLCCHDIDTSLQLWQTVTDVVHQQLTSTIQDCTYTCISETPLSSLMHSNSYYPDASLIFYLHLTHIFAAQTKNIFFSPTQNN